MSDPIYEWPVDTLGDRVICAAPLMRVPDCKFKLGFRLDNCHAELPRGYTIREMMGFLRAHICAVEHDLEIDMDELLSWTDPPKPVPASLSVMPAHNTLYASAGYISNARSASLGPTQFTSVDFSGPLYGTAETTYINWAQSSAWTTYLKS